MKNTRLFQSQSFLLAALLVTGILTHAADKNSHSGHWSYSGKLSPEHWGSLSGEFSLCSSGRHQSPVDLGEAIKPTAVAISFHYKETPLQIVNNGHTIQINYAPGSYAEFGGKRYELAQFHFHSPSEHTVAGEHYEMEAHLVHRDAQGALAVVGVLLKSGNENAGLKAAWKNLPRTTGERAVEGMAVDASTLLPVGREYYSYSGSLTTPPCSEGVSWYVMAEPVEVSVGQIDAFHAIVEPNARPVQPFADDGSIAAHH
jgi:carbonic anhydrase